MLQKTTLIFITAIVLLLFSKAEAQYEARLMPGYLDAEVYADEVMSNDVRWRINHIRPQKIPASAWKMKSGTDKIMQESGIELINCTKSQLSQDETWMTINPYNPAQIVASSNDSRYNGSGGQYKMAAYYSHDGGANWSTSLTPNNVGKWLEPASGVHFTNFDPGLAFDHEGNIYYCYGFAQLKDGENLDNGVFVNKSTDGGKTWQDPVPVALELSGSTSQPFHDKFLIACDNQENSPYKGRVYVAWSVMDNGSEIVLSYSEDGENFSFYESVSKHIKSVQSAMPVVGPDGELYVAFRSHTGDETQAFINKSTDGGKSLLWSTPKRAQSVKTIGDYSTSTGRNALLDKQDIRISSYPAIDVDRSNGPRRGWVYIVQSGVDGEGNSGIFFARSTDGGENWLNNVRADNNSLNNDCFMPSISVDPASGLIAILYYSSQNDPENVGADAYLAVSRDGGDTFQHVRLTGQTWYFNDAGDVSRQGGSLGNYWGDYTSIVAFNNKIYPCFWMPAEPDLHNSYHTNDAYTAILSPNPKPPTDLEAAPETSDPSLITIRWIDPETTMLGEILSDFKIVIMDKNFNELAEVARGVQQYDVPNVPIGENYTFHLKTRLPGGEESRVVSVNGIGGGALQPYPPYDISFEPHENGVILTWKNPSYHIDGSVFHDFEKINIYIEDQIAATVTDVNAGELSTEVVEIPTGQFHKIKLTAVGIRGGIETESTFSGEVLVYAGAPLDEFEDNFDNSDNRIPTYTDGDWGVTNAAYVTEPNCLTDSPEGMYPIFKTSRIVFAPTTIKSGMSTLAFYHIAIVSSNDHSAISISEDNMKTWYDLRWFNSESSDKFNKNIDDSDWEAYTIDLSEYEGKTVFLKFDMVSESVQSRDGYYVDDFRIDDTPVSVEDRNIIENMTVNTYPNPASDKCRMDLILGEAVESSNVGLFDALGRQLINIKNGRMMSGLNSFNINLETLPSGMYYTKITLNGVSKTYPIVVSR